MKLAGAHYMPVLKLKLAEKAALRALTVSALPNVIPLLDLVERKPEKQSLDAYLKTSFRRLAESVGGYPRCLLDAQAIAPDGEAAAREVFRRAAIEGIAFTPVTGLSRIVDVRPTLEHRDRGIALRLTQAEFEAGNLQRAVRAFLTLHSLAASDVDLIVDLGSVTEFVVPGVQALTAQFVAEVPDLAHWKTFTLTASAFPFGLGTVKGNSHDQVERIEWTAWRGGLFEERAGLERLPSYGDGCIQHPQGVEDFDFRTMDVSAAIRYTTEGSWLLIKGKSVRVLRPSIQFPALARELVRGELRDHFRGAAHCAGCLGIHAAANGEPNFGSLTKWRELGTIHHMTTVAEQLAALPAP